MKGTMRRMLWLGLLFAFAIFWVFLMSLGAVRSGSATGPDGSTASVTRINADEAFPEVKAHMLLRDAAEEPLKGLPKEAFELTEDEIPVDITSFLGAGGQAVTAILVIDHSGSMGGDKMRGAKEAAKVFVSMTREDKDNLGILVFGSDINMLVPLDSVSASDKETLKRQIDGVRARGGTAFHDAVYSALRQLDGASGRTVVIALTDGKDTGSRQSVDDVIRLAKTNFIPIYTVGLKDGWFSLDSDGLTRLAEETGGEYFETPSADELAEWYRTLADELQNEYVLGYTSPTPDLDGTQREVAVRINYDEGEMRVSGPYAVAGLLKSSINYPVFGTLLLLLLLLLAAPTVKQQLPKRRRADKIAEPVPPMPPPSASPVPARPTPPPSEGSVLASEGSVLASEGSVLASEGSVLASEGSVLASPPISQPRHQIKRPIPSKVAAARLVMRSSIAKEHVTIGSGAGCELLIPAPAIAPQHARIGIENGRYVVTDLSQGHTAVSFSGDPAQMRPVAKNALKDGSLVRIGNVTLQFRLPAQGLPWLDVIYQIAPNGANIGSAAGNQITLSHPSVSPRHAELRQKADRWMVRDLDSSQGTFVSYNGNPTQERQVLSNALKNGSTVRFGQVTLVFKTEVGSRK